MLCAVPFVEKKNQIYLPQVPHKATRKRVFETHFLYIKEKKDTISIVYQKRHLNTVTVFPYSLQ